MKNIFFILLCVLGFLAASMPAEAQYRYSYSGRTSAGFRYGAVPGLENYTPGNKSTDIVNVSFGAGINNNLLGCAGIDLEASFRGILNALNPSQIAQKMQQQFTTAISNWLLTQIYSSPALAAIFDSLEAFGNARLSMVQEGCALTEDMTAKRKEVLAKAREECMDNNGHDPITCFMVNGNQALHNAAQDVVNNDYNKSLHEALGPSLGPLTALIPDMRWCMNNNCSASDTKSAEAINQGATFTISRNLASRAMHGDILAMRELVDHYGEGRVASELNLFMAQREVDEDVMIAQDARDSSHRPFLADVRLGALEFAQPYITGIPCQRGQANCAISINGANVTYTSFWTTEWKEKVMDFINCRHGEIGSDFVDFVRVAFPSYSLPNVESVDVGGLLPPTGTYSAVYSQLMNNGVPDALKMIETVTACVYNHQVHMSPKTVFDISDLSAGEREGIIASAGNRVAFLATEVILRFTKHNLLEVYAEKSFNAGEGGDEVPAHILDAVRLTADGIENRIQALKAVDNAQQLFAKAMALVEKRRRETIEKIKNTPPNELIKGGSGV